MGPPKHACSLCASSPQQNAQASKLQKIQFSKTPICIKASSFNFKRFFFFFDKLLEKGVKIQIYPLRIDFRPIRTPKDRSIGLHGVLHKFFKVGQEGVWGRTTTPSPYRSMINNLKLVSWQIALR